MYFLVNLLSWPHWSCSCVHNVHIPQDNAWWLVHQHQHQSPTFEKSNLHHSPLPPWTMTLTFMPLPCPRKTQPLVLVMPPSKVIFCVNTCLISPASFPSPRVSATLGPILQLARSSHIVTLGVNLDSKPVGLDDYGLS